MWHHKRRGCRRDEHVITVEEAVAVPVTRSEQLGEQRRECHWRRCAELHRRDGGYVELCRAEDAHW